MQNLVGIGIADAAQQVRIGQRALQRVILARQRLAELLDGRRQHFEAAGIVRRELPLRRAPDTATRGASIPLRSGSASPLSKSKCGETDLAGNLGAGRSRNLKRPGDHQVDDQEQIVFELPDQPLAKPAQPDDLLAVGADRSADRRSERGTGWRFESRSSVRPTMRDRSACR